MFPLRGEAVVFGDDCPAVGQLTDCGFAGIDHWLDRENHVGFQLGPGASLSIMNYLWVFMKFCSDPVATEFAHNRVAGFLGVALNGVADVTKACSCLDLRNPKP